MPQAYLDEMQRAYYYGEPIATDEEYDVAVEHLKQCDPTHPFLTRIGAPVPGTVKVKHSIPMGSQDNIHNLEEFKKWIKRIKAKENTCYCLQDKLDGLSVELVYENGVFIRAITRGDGIYGEDVTKNVLCSRSFKSLSVSKYIYSVRVECILSKETFQTKFKDKKNPRNAAAGALRKQNSKYAKFLDFVAFDYTGADPILNEDAKLTWLKANGFKTPRTEMAYSVEEAWSAFKQFENKRSSYKYEVDGVVIKVNHTIFNQEIINGRPLAQRALKFKPQGAFTELLDIIWQVGSQGTLCPVAALKAVDVGGTTIRKTSVYNFDEIQRLGIAIGDTVEVVRAADVIPKIAKRVEKGKNRIKITMPESCPECGARVKRENVNIYCTNPQCNGTLFQQILNWVKKRNIMFLGEGILRAAWDSNALHEGIVGLYAMNLVEWSNVRIGNSRLGKVRSKKIFKELLESRKISLPDFLGSLSLRGTGCALMRVVCKELKATTLHEFWKSVDQKNIIKRLNRIPNFSEKRTTKLLSELSINRIYINAIGAYMHIGSSEREGVLNGEVICFTGDAGVKRNILQKLVEDNGGEFKTSVTKDTTALVIADINSQSSKAKKARANSIRLITPVDFLNSVNYNPFGG